MARPVMLLDGAGLWFRSYFAVPTSITDPDGRPVNAVRGVLDTVATLVTTHRPHRLVVCRDDAWRPRWRVEAVPSYKAHRVADGASSDGPDSEEVPDELSPQVGWILELLDAVGIAHAGAPDCEADDVLGTLAARERRDPVIVVSGDRDLLQVVADTPVPVRVLYLGRGLAKATLYGPAEVARDYGVPADRAGAAYAELALLRGDPSDGLPGVAGVGEKTAARLLREHGDLPGILAAVDDARSPMAAGVRAKLTAARDYLRDAEAVVRVRTDADVTFSQADDTLPASAQDRELVAELARRRGVASSVGRLAQALAAADPD